MSGKMHDDRGTMSRGNKRKGGNRSRKNFQSKRSQGREQQENVNTYNDISWYSRYPDLLLAAGSFPYPNRPGMDLSVSSDATNDKWKIPGIVTLEWGPSFGYSKSATDPASVVAKEIYRKVRSKYSGALDADAPDFVMYIMALDSVFAYIAHMKRIYRITSAYSPDNYVIPIGLLESLGFTEQQANSLISSRIMLWQSINELVYQVRKFICPAVMDIFNRHYWMSDNVYTDANTINSQWYVFKPAYLFKYKAQQIPGSDPAIYASGLTVVSPPTDTWTNMYGFGKELIEALASWDDSYTINGYLQRAYEDAPVFTVSELGMDETLQPIYNEEVLSQIENARNVGFSNWGTSLNFHHEVAQDPSTNAVIADPIIEVINASLAPNYPLYDTTRPLLSMRSDKPTVADTVIASRLHCTVRREGTTSKYHVIAGTEILLSMHLWHNFSKPQFIQSVGELSDIVNANNTDHNILGLSQFDWSPIIIAYDMLGDNYPVTIFGDVHNATTVMKEQLEDLHRVCVYSELNAFDA